MYVWLMNTFQINVIRCMKVSTIVSDCVFSTRNNDLMILVLKVFINHFSKHQFAMLLFAVMYVLCYLNNFFNKYFTFISILSVFSNSITNTNNFVIIFYAQDSSKLLRPSTVFAVLNHFQ